MIELGDALHVLKEVPSKLFDCCITSPPYWGLRDYGINGQLGQEKTPDDYVSNLVSVLREVRRTLRDDGTLWLNLGDSYASSGKNRTIDQAVSKNKLYGGSRTQQQSLKQKSKIIGGLKPKDLVGIPWRVAFALQSDGWYLRQDIIWSKTNPMPESVKDRCTKSHEYIFLLSKSEKYYFDLEAIKEPAIWRRRRKDQKKGEFNAKGEPIKGRLPFRAIRDLRQKRSVWTVSTKPFKGAHFATFPQDLIEPCVRAGSRPHGVVLDPFCGSGTTWLVSEKNGRGFFGIDINPEYKTMAENRLKNYKLTEVNNGLQSI